MAIGFIQDDLDLKLLVLYITDRAAGPITFLQLFELALCDAGVDYFSLSQAVEHMVATGQLRKEEGRYAITDKGRRNSQICESSLPYSVRIHCDENLIKVNDALRREAQIQARVSDNPDGTATLHLIFNDMDAPMLRMELLAPDSSRAGRWGQAFKADPGRLYLAVTTLLDEEETHEKK